MLTQSKFLSRFLYRNLVFSRRYYFNQQKTPEEQSKEQIKEMLEEETNEQQEQKSSTTQIYALGAVGLIVGYIFMQLNMMTYKNKTKSTKEMKVKYSGKAMIGGPWNLLKPDGTPISDKDMRGSYYLMYFGFCNCPDICPNQLFKLSKALAKIRKMPEGKMIKIKPLFVTVDPDRDNAERIEKFLSHFDSSFIGITAKSNDDPDLKDAMRQFKIYATKIKYEMDEEDKKTDDEQKYKDLYTMDHTIITYLMDDENNYVTHLGSNMSENDLAHQIIESIMENEKSKMRR